MKSTVAKGVCRPDAPMWLGSIAIAVWLGISGWFAWEQSVIAVLTLWIPAKQRGACISMVSFMIAFSAYSS
jgi:hypothetical protein